MKSSKITQVLLTVISAVCLTSSVAYADSISFTGAVVTWTATQSGYYRITAIGAQGNAAGFQQFATSPGQFQGGRGAEEAGSFYLSAGEVLDVAVGGQGVSSAYFGGGGGGTFVVDALGNDPLVVAGGGGGVGRDTSESGTDASISLYGYSGSGNQYSYTPSLLVTSAGLGGAAAPQGYGSSGAGFYSDGAGDTGYGSAGSDWANGLAGGTSGNPGAGGLANGGFGGGGAGNGDPNGRGGGGGGGYSGGQAGWVAGGGGSFNGDAAGFALAGVGYGNGSVEIDFIAAAPEPGTMMLLGAGLLGFGLIPGIRRRRAGLRNRG